jgi:hypothetical protein
VREFPWDTEDVSLMCGPTIVLVDDETDQHGIGRTDVDTASTRIDPAAGPLRFRPCTIVGDTSTKVVVRSSGLHLKEA